jgi:hypothetical protein
VKKSLREALNRAKQLSISHPACKVYVMDKPRCRKPLVLTNQWCIKESMFEGYYGVATFLNGERG